MHKRGGLWNMLERWPSAIVARSSMREFTGGLMAPATMANLDAAGQGPKGMMRVGRKTCYEAVEVVKWLESRLDERNYSYLAEVGRGRGPLKVKDKTSNNQ